MFCVKCGAKIEEGAAFCVQCGTPVENIVAMIDAVHEFNGDR